MSTVDIYTLLKSINDNDINSIIQRVTAASFHQQDIYLGCGDGYVHKVENQLLDDEEETSFITSLLDSVLLIENRAVKQIEICSMLNMIAVLINESIVFLNENPLQVKSLNTRLKNVTTFAISERLTEEGDYITELCVGLSSGRVQLHTLSPDRLTLRHEVSLPSSSIPSTIALSHDTACLAAGGQYTLVSLSPSHRQITPLFDHPAAETALTSLPHSQGFLLLGPDGLGMFADLEGCSQRPPLQWGSAVRQFALCSAGKHVLATDREFVTVHELNSQQQIQTLHLPNRACLLVPSRLAGALLLYQPQQQPAGTDGQQQEWCMAQLSPASWHRQAMQLLDNHRTDKAAAMANKVLSDTHAEHRTRKKAQHILSIAGFQKFAKCQFKEAKTLLEKGNTDLRELIICYPGLMPKSYKFEPCIATTESGFRLQVNKPTEDVMAMTEYKWFLLDFLLEHRDSSLARQFGQIVETALVKLHVELEPRQLHLNLSLMLADVDHEDLVEHLQDHGHRHACALVMQWYGRLEAAVDIWAQLVQGRGAPDPHFPGPDFVKEVLVNLSDPGIIRKNLTWLLDFDSEFTGKLVCDFVEQFHTETDLVQILTADGTLFRAVTAYRDVNVALLLVLCRHHLLESSDKHDELGSLFVDKLMEIHENEEEFDTLRLQFVEFLGCSGRYRGTSLLRRVQAMPRPLWREEALIRGRMGDHDAGLGLLVDREPDFAVTAADYCIRFSGSGSTSMGGSQDGGSLFRRLLAIYLNRCNGGKDADVEKELIYKNAAFDLLKTHSDRFNMKEVLAMLPESWSLVRLSDFLASSIAQQRSHSSEGAMTCGLQRVLRMRRLAESRTEIYQQRLVIPVSATCGACGGLLDSCSFLRSARDNGTLFHKHCYNQM